MMRPTVALVWITWGKRRDNPARNDGYGLSAGRDPYRRTGSRATFAAMRCSGIVRRVDGRLEGFEIPSRANMGHVRPEPGDEIWMVEAGSPRVERYRVRAVDDPAAHNLAIDCLA
jgi:hypothetical protein